MALRLPAGRALPVTAASAPAGLAARRSAAMASRSRALAAIGRHRLRAAAAVPWSRARASPPALPLRASASPAPSPRGADRAGSTRASAVADVAETGAEVRTGGYPFADIEARWQKHWAENKTFATPDLVDTSKPKFYALDMFPYPRCAAYTTPGARRVALLDRCTTRPRPDTLNPLETPRCPSKRPFAALHSPTTRPPSVRSRSLITPSIN